jgi:biopolymer transport protein ExbD
MQFRPLKKSQPSLNVVPLVDVLLTLLIFFAVSSTFVVQQGVKVELPEAGPSENRTDRELLVTISVDGALYFGRARTSLQELPELIRAAVTPRRAAGLLVIKADQGVRHGLVVQVMDAAKQSGVQRLAIATRLRGRQP